MSGPFRSAAVSSIWMVSCRYDEVRGRVNALCSEHRKSGQSVCVEVVQFTLQMYVPSFRQISSRALQAVVCEC